MIHLESNYSDMEREIDRIQGMPDVKTRIALDNVLATAFAATQAFVHVETGSLKSSGKSESSFKKTTKTWEGEIQYGGPSGGVNNPVDYAIYEKARDGLHDFMSPVKLLDPAYRLAILSMLGGKK